MVTEEVNSGNTSIRLKLSYCMPSGMLDAYHPHISHVSVSDSFQIGYNSFMFLYVQRSFPAYTVTDYD